MSTETMIHMATTDTAEQVTAPVLPADDRPGDGYDWMDTLDGTSWSVLPNWGSEGWDAGSWPYIIFAVARTRDGNGELFGYGTYVEGDTAAHWFRSQGACFEAITAEVFFHWASGQSDGPENLPEPALLELIANVLKLGDGDEVIWATDLNHGGPALLIAMLVAHGQNVLYIPGRIVHHASRLYRGEGKTDAKDAAVIADQARMRRDLQPLRAGDETSTGLRILTARRADKSADRVRAINRLQAQLLEYFPALERAFDYSRSKAALFLLTKHRTPDGIRRTGQARLHAWLKKHGARSSAAVAQAAVDAAKSQHTTVPAQHVGELIVAALAREIITLDKELAELDALIGEKVTEHRHARTLLSMPGFGPVLAAEFLGATGGDMTVFETADRFAGVAGLAPAPGTPAGLPATTTAPAATTGGCFGSSTSPASRP